MEEKSVVYSADSSCDPSGTALVVVVTGTPVVVGLVLRLLRRRFDEIPLIAGEEFAGSDMLCVVICVTLAAVTADTAGLGTGCEGDDNGANLGVTGVETVAADKALPGTDGFEATAGAVGFTTTVAAVVALPADEIGGMFFGNLSHFHACKVSNLSNEVGRCIH